MHVSAICSRWFTLIICLCLPVSGLAILPVELLSGSRPESLILRFPRPGLNSNDRLLIIATSSTPNGAAMVPFARNKTGSTLFLPFQADHLLLLRSSHGKVETTLRSFNGFGFGPSRGNYGDLTVLSDKSGSLSLEIPRAWTGTNTSLNLVATLKEMSVNHGWGRIMDSTDPYLAPGQDDRYLSHYLSFMLPQSFSSSPAVCTLVARRGGKLRIYQMLPRLSGNTNTNRIPNGTYEQNGCGKFSDLNDTALTSIKNLGFDAIWVTGVLRQATIRDYSTLGLPPDDPDIVKGLAGSPYAIRDYYDVCPDYAIDPAKRLEEFKQLLARAKKNGLRVFMDFIPNHVARSYASVVHPERDFGREDMRNEFFSGDDFYYLKPGPEGPPLRLPSVNPNTKEILSPTARVIWEDKENRFPGLKGQIDGLFPPEMLHGRVTGDNQNTWCPGPTSWSETCKLNYGYNFTQENAGKRKHPSVTQAYVSIPRLWMKMDAILAYWQGMGVDGFRCDAAHMIPSEFWHWALARAHERNSETFFYAECYEGDTRYEVPDANPDLAPLHSNPTSLLEAGFDAVYGHDVYRRLLDIYGGKASANDLDSAARPGFVGDNSLRYAENHDECRLASPQHWSGIGAGVGRPVCAILFGLSRGPVMMYYGQEVGEPANLGASGFEGDNGRTTFFDYWSLPSLQKWINGGAYDGGGLSSREKELRLFYGRLLHSLSNTALTQGNLYVLNPSNRENPTYGRIAGNMESGRWLYAFLRHNPITNKSLLVIVNLHPTEAFLGVKLKLSSDATSALSLPAATTLTGTDLLAATNPSTISCDARDLVASGISLPDLPPLSAFYFDLSTR